MAWGQQLQRRYSATANVRGPRAARMESAAGWRIGEVGRRALFAGLAALGAGEILLTSMDRDGTRDGYDLALTRAVANRVDVPVVASGGVGALDHLVAGVTEGGASAVLAASIFHFGEATIADAHRALAAAGVPVRGR